MENNNEIKSKKIEFNISTSYLDDLVDKIDKKDLSAVDSLLAKFTPRILQK